MPYSTKNIVIINYLLSIPVFALEQVFQSCASYNVIMPLYILHDCMYVLTLVPDERHGYIAFQAGMLEIWTSV